MTRSPAIFLDRDGTIIEQVHHLSRVDDVRVYDFAREALELFTVAGFRLVIVTNQSAIGRGLLTESGLSAIHDEMLRQLGGESLFAGIYHCPTVPHSDDRTIIEDPDRKPGPGMLLRAAGEHDLDLSRSWMIGDSLSDILAGINAGCRGTVLVRTGYGTRTQESHDAVLRDVNCHITDNLGSAARLLLANPEADRPVSRDLAPDQQPTPVRPVPSPHLGGRGPG